MSKICTNCGCPVDDNSLFCATCGAKVEAQQPQQPAQPEQPANNQYDNFGYQAPQQPSYNQYDNFGYQAPQQPAPAPAAKKGPNMKMIGIIAGAAVAAIIAIILIVTLVFSPKAAAKKYVRAMINGNAKQVVNCYPSFFYEDKDEKKEAIEFYEEMLEELELDEYDKVKYEIKSVEKLSKSERDDLEDLLELYEEFNDNYKEGSIKVKNARKVEVKITIKDGGETYRETFEILLVKYKGQWKVLTSDLGF